MTLHRAYSLLEIKSFDEDKRELVGMATTPEVDRLGDIVEPKGAEFKLPLPFLWQHDAHQPIGQVTAAKVTKDGIEIRAKILKIDEPGKLKDRLDEAWQSIKHGLVRGLSIGFTSRESERIEKTSGIRFLKWAWLELSAVVIAANAEASITSIKSVDNEQRAASGQTRSGVVRLDPPAVVSAKPKAEEAKSMTVSDQIKSFEAKRVASAERMEAIMATAAETSSTLDEAQTEEYDTLEGEVKSVDSHLVRLRKLESAQASKAKPVDPVKTMTVEKGSEVRAGIITIKDNLPPGIEFARYVKCLAASRGNLTEAADIAKAWYPDNPRIHSVIKASVVAGTTTDATWAGPLVDVPTFAGDFIEYLRPQTIIGKFGTGGIPSLRRVPFNIRIVGQTSGGDGYWVGQGAPKPLTKFDFNAVTLGFTKVANIAVLTEELVRFSNPAAEGLVRDALRDAIMFRLDTDFTDPAKAAVAGVSPASITNGISAIASTGTTSEAVKQDVAALMGAYIAANITPSTGVWIMSAVTALSLSLMTNPLGQPEFPGITMTGGTFMGLPVIVSQYVKNTVTGANVILINASDIYLADDGQVTVEASKEASLQMLDNPTDNSATATATTLVSMWQTNSVAIRAERFINWQRRRTASVQYLTGVFWNGEQT